MIALVATGLTPDPFTYTPLGGKVEGQAFSRPFQMLATLLVAGCFSWVLRLWLRDAITWGPGMVWVVAGLAMMAWTWVCVLRSRTVIDGLVLQQRWIWNKRLALGELAYCKVIRMPGLDWLVAPRLYARTLSGKFLVFYGATPALVAEFSRLSRELADFRRM
ncbi:hypothetical protein GT347_00330 [Xylophilus rhododendri]|uniref:PH domain-containing protein n=1 Tax=Xylophilus rhododendri TaxID=2697032 RepID=A0A857J0U5_9BURK|nr:hypothetical protein [Xylophilus rhododendri]QHI96578.1 hypothetical protein GT347_00330 [Xylophilus rhododendri]